MNKSSNTIRSNRTEERVFLESCIFVDDFSGLRRFLEDVFFLCLEFSAVEKRILVSVLPVPNASFLLLPRFTGVFNRENLFGR